MLVRVDFNVPLADKDPNQPTTVTDDNRIQAALPTLNYLLEGCGAYPFTSAAPNGRRQAICDEPRGRQRANCSAARELDEVVGESVTAAVAAMQPGDIILLENTRFEPGETKNYLTLSQALADLADVYVDDAFGSRTAPIPARKGRPKPFKPRGRGRGWLPDGQRN